MVTMIPVFLIWKDLGFLGTRVPLWGGNLFGSAFYIFMLRQFFLGLPRELFEAARVDGCSYFGLFWRIAVPLSRPALIIVFVFEFQASWDDLLKPLIYLGQQRRPVHRAARTELAVRQVQPDRRRQRRLPVHRHRRAAGHHPDDPDLPVRPAILRRRHRHPRSEGLKPMAVKPEPGSGAPRRIYMVGSTHIDPVWLWHWQEGYAEARATFTWALDRIDEYPEFVFTMDHIVLLRWICDHDPNLFERIGNA